MSKLTGKIYWVESDFSFNGCHIPKKDETSHTVTRIENAIVDDHMIKFTSTPVDHGNYQFGYNVNLIANDKGLGFTGSFSDTTDGDWKGEITCEVFENKKAFLLFGKWTEEEIIYTWWARIDKNASR